jgi:integrase/recombinase XerD
MVNRTKIKIDWTIKSNTDDFKRELAHYSKYLREQGLRESTIKGFTAKLSRYLKGEKTTHPTIQDSENFLKSLHEWKKARNTINQYAYTLRFFHRMQGEELKVKRLSTNDKIPYYFTSEEIAKIFDVCDNLKHKAMLMTLFYCMLRSSELCNLNIEDLDLKNLAIRIIDGKMGKDALVPMNAETARMLSEYLELRPAITVNGASPVFITDYGRRWEPSSLYRMFIEYKKRASITRPGGVHCFSRHSSASLLAKNNCDILTIQRLLRHSDPKTTMRYLHTNDEIIREKYNKFLRL